MRDLIIPSSVVVLPQAAIPVQAAGHVLGTGKTKTNFLGLYSAPLVPREYVLDIMLRREDGCGPFIRLMNGRSLVDAVVEPRRSSTFQWNVHFILHDPRVCVC